MSYADAWEKTKEVADNILQGVECIGCPYDPICPKCPAMRLSDYKKGHCNQNLCELTCRLVKEGIKKLDESAASSCEI